MEAWGPDGSVRLMMADRTSRLLSPEELKTADRERFLALARRFKESSNPDESERLREELAQLIFGE
jgi:hypothetical protein